MKDLIIIGAGPAGLSAAIYGKRSGLDLLVIEKLSPGGQVINTAEVENYPGFAQPVAGWELVSAMENQARRLESEIISAEVKKVKHLDNGNHIVETNKEEWEARAVIAATGSFWKKLGVPGEEEFLGRGVSYCATCDGAFFKDKITAVVGGGNTALEEALFLTKFASKVYLIHRRDKLRGSRIIQERVLNHPKVEPVCDTIVERINGTDKLENLSIINVKNNEESILKTDGIFIFIGVNPCTEYLPAEVVADNKMVKVNMQMQTVLPGLFAAGDIRTGSRRQIVTAAADGAIAAMSAYEYITNSEL